MSKELDPGRKGTPLTLFEIIDLGPQPDDDGGRFEILVRHPHVASEMSVFYDTEAEALDQGRDILLAILERRYTQFWIERGEPARNAPLVSA